MTDTRILFRMDGYFYPGKIQEISPPDIYGVLVDHERGNKPHILTREEILNEVVSASHSLLTNLPLEAFIRGIFLSIDIGDATTFN